MPFAARFLSTSFVVASAIALAWGIPAVAGPRASRRASSAPPPSPPASPPMLAPAAPPGPAHPHATVSIPLPGGGEARCLENPPLTFLVRKNWFNGSKEGPGLFQQSLKFRTEKYGYFHGFGRPEWNEFPPGHYAVAATFLGLPIQIHKRVVPALACAEAALIADGATKEYKPRGIGGIRFHNTYHGGEVSNHVYGIAMDMDSDVNTCCGCVGAWAKHPLCGRKVKSIYERTKVPPIWVETMERYGWYWLGNDVLQDTMHFEFLGDPDRIVAEASSASTASRASAPSPSPSTAASPPSGAVVPPTAAH